MSFVLDSSTTIAWLHPWERTAQVELFFNSLAGSGGWVPSLWWLEVANVLQMNVKRKRYDLSIRYTYLDLLSQLPISTDRFTDTSAWTSTLNLAHRHDLTVYDAAYLELAIRLRLPLATLDQDLQIAATNENVSLVSL